MDELLIAARAIHFAATAAFAGGAVFAWTVAAPAFRLAGAPAAQAAECWRRRLAAIVWAALATALASGAAWLVLLAAGIVGRPVLAAIADGTAWAVLTQTGFGHAWLIRLALAALFAAAGALPRAAHGFKVACAAAFLGTLAWSGHAAGTPGALGDLHRLADVLHLTAAGAWLGALVPLFLLLRRAGRAAAAPLAAVARAATLRFSVLGQIAVATLLATGSINAVLLVGSLANLVGTDYGRLLIGKVALFAVMVLVAAVNRFRLTPRLPDAQAARALARNALIETALGLAILGIVAVLGILPPAIQGGHLH